MENQKKYNIHRKVTKSYDLNNNNISILSKDNSVFSTVLPQSLL